MDNWPDSKTSRQCRTCMWYVQKGMGDIGRCRRHAPSMSGYPVVYISDWCGDHKPECEIIPPIPPMPSMPSMEVNNV